MSTANVGVDMGVVRDDLGGDVQPRADADRASRTGRCARSPTTNARRGWRASTGPDGIVK